MTYKKIQFIGYAIDTGPGWDDGHSIYLGLPDPRKDIDARCILMRRAMETARDQLSKKSPPEKTLKLFMAPEFFLRGDKGAYDMDSVQYAIRELQKIAAEDQWEDWLIVFGTILGEWDQDEHAADKYAVNFALIQEGGVATAGPTGARIVTKELKSHIDFIAHNPNPGGILLGNIEHMDTGPMGPGREAQRLEYDGAGIFEACGITWAADICKDHLLGRLLRSPQLPGSNEVQVQLIPSGGASIRSGAVIAERDGFVFNVDGLNGSSATLKQNTAPMSTIDPLPETDVSNDDIDLPDTSPVEKVRIDQLYAQGPGQIVIYDSLTVPQKRQVKGPEPVKLHWDTRRDISFNFDLIFDDAGKFVTVTCQINAPEIRNDRNRYFVPLDLQTRDEEGEKLLVTMQLASGADGYDRSLICNVESDRFDFSGIAFLFNERHPQPKVPDPKTAW